MTITDWITGCLILAIGCLDARAGDDPWLDGDGRKPGKPYVEWLRREPELVKGRSTPLNPVQIRMVYIPGGRFDFGSPEAEAGRNKSEGPQKQLTIEPFWMAQFETTNDAYCLFENWHVESDFFRLHNKDLLVTERMRQAASIFGPTEPQQRVAIRREDLRHDKSRFPVRGVAQYAAQKYCQWLTLRTGRLYRLPTEAEWEYAARAGTTTRYYFGDDEKRLVDYAWHGRPDEGPSEVGRLKSNPWGLYDMYGNVAEWVLDGWSADHETLGTPANRLPWVARHTANVDTGGVVRGGDYSSVSSDLRSAARRGYRDHCLDWEFPPKYDMSDEGVKIGFRIISPVEVPKKSDGRESYLFQDIFSRSRDSK